MSKNLIINDLLALSTDIRYVAVYRDGHLERASRPGTSNPSSGDSDRYEELLVNPTLLKLATQRGDIDCGGLDYLLIRYGSFYQLVQGMPWGHVSVCIDRDADPIRLHDKVASLIAPSRGVG